MSRGTRWTQEQVNAYKARASREHDKGLAMSEIVNASDEKSERELQDQIGDYLRVRDIYFVRSRMDKRTTNAKGTPDFICCFGGRFVGIEIKVGKNECTPEQLDAHDEIRRASGLVRVACSLQQVKDFLDSVV